MRPLSATLPLLLLCWPALAQPVTLAVPDLAVLDLSPARGVFYTEHLSSRLTEAGLQVTTAKAIAQLLGAERQRQMAGCGTSGDSCVAEIASALGSDGVVLGQVGRIDGGYQLDLKVISAKDARIISTFSGRVPSEGALLDLFANAAAKLAQDTARELGRALGPTAAVAPAAATSSPLRPAGYVTGGVGLASAVVGSVLLIQAKGKADALPAPDSGAAPIPFADAQALATSGKALQTAGWACVIAGGALLAAGVALVLAAPADAPSVALAVDSSGAAVVVSGRF